MVSVMNTAMGHPDDYDLPFDLRHARRPILFDCSDAAGEKERKKIKSALTKDLVTAAKAIFDDKIARAEMLPQSSTVPHPHDVELLSLVRRLLRHPRQRFLLEHGFATPFRYEFLDPIYEINNWLGAAFEFHNPILQASFADLRNTAQELGRLVSLQTYPEDGGILGRVKTHDDMRHGLQPETKRVIRELNEKATELSHAIDAFERCARAGSYRLRRHNKPLEPLTNQ